ncbi:hypothetical protein HDU76_008452, partial [Blyttiomyces sp. JEL0837]
MSESVRSRGSPTLNHAYMTSYINTPTDTTVLLPSPPPSPKSVPLKRRAVPSSLSSPADDHDNIPHFADLDNAFHSQPTVPGTKEPHSGLPPLLRPQPKTWDYYLVYILVVLPLRSIVGISPLIFIALTLNHYTPLPPTLTTPITTNISQKTLNTIHFFTTIETIWAIYHYISHRRLSILTLPPPNINNISSKSTNNNPHHTFLLRCLTDVSDIRSFVSGWFYNRTVEEIDREYACWVSDGVVDLDSYDEEDDVELEPVFFVHGIGIGLIVYIPFILNLRLSAPTRRLILIELRHVSMQLEDHVPSSTQTIIDIEELCNDLEIRGPAIWIGHSLGSVSSLESFQGCAGGSSGPKTGLDLVLKYIVSQELHIAHTLRRHFWWYENVLLPENLPRSTPPPKQTLKNGINSKPNVKLNKQPTASIFLSSKDQIIYAASVEKHIDDCVKIGLAAGRVMVHTWEGFSH